MYVPVLLEGRSNTEKLLSFGLCQGPGIEMDQAGDLLDDRCSVSLCGANKDNLTYI